MNEKVKCAHCHNPIEWKPVIERGNSFCDNTCFAFFQAGVGQAKPTKIPIENGAEKDKYHSPPTGECVQRELNLGNE